MRSTTLWVSGLAVLAGAMVASMAVAAESSGQLVKGGNGPQLDSRIQQFTVILPGQATPDMIKPIPAGMPIRQYHRPGQGAVSGAVGTLVYSNIDGDIFFAAGAGVLMADDITTIAAGGCDMTFYEILVVGGGDGTGPGFTVDYALYTGCPGDGGTIIPGTEGSDDLPDDGGWLVSLDFEGAEIGIPNQLFVGATVSTAEAGWVAGMPATIGSSDDVFYIPASAGGFDCNTFLGGFPANPHASVYAQVFCAGEPETQFDAFLSDVASGFFFGGDGCTAGGLDACGDGVNPDISCESVADDIQLSVDNCDLVQYEVQLAGAGGPYEAEFELWTDLDGVPDAPIPGTACCFQGLGNGFLEAAVCTADAGVVIPGNVWLVMQDDTPDGGPIISGGQATIGFSDDCFSVFETPGDWSACVFFFGGCLAPPNFICGSFNARVTCLGDPFGACCESDADGATCTDGVLSTNCDGRWAQGSSCNAAPFTPACGVASCCLADSGCQNMTLADCGAANGLWQPNRFCGEGDQACPDLACVLADQPCDQPSPNGGCTNGDCCTAVCDLDSFCCDTQWDNACVALAAETPICLGTPDTCADAPIEDLPHTYEGSNVVAINTCSSFAGNHSWIAFTLPQASGVTLNYCGTPSVFANAWLNLASSCPCEDGPNTAAGAFNFTDCADGNVTIIWAELPAGDYYYAILSEPGAIGDYVINVSADSVVAPDNDDCADALPIADGDTDFNTIGATMDGVDVPASCDEGFGVTIDTDIWYLYTAPCTAAYTFSTCDQATFDTRLALYEGSACPATNDRLVGCNDDGDGCTAFSSVMVTNLTGGVTYLLRVGGFPPATGTGTLTISHDECQVTSCPTGAVSFVNPVDGTVDARQPHPVGSALPLQGISVLEVTAPTGADASCWTLCETNDGGAANGVASVVENAGTYTITLDRPITAGAVTKITYTDDDAGTATGTFTSHPANANGDSASTPVDIIELIDFLNGAAVAPYGIYSEDIDQSGLFAPGDIITLIDLLNGAGEFVQWDGSSLPDGAGCP